MSNRKPYNDKAGYVASRHNMINNGWVVIYVAKEQGLEDEAGKYAVVCELHKTLTFVTSIPKARPMLKCPDFCEDCMKDYKPQTLNTADKAVQHEYEAWAEKEAVYTPALHDLVTLRGSTTLQYRVARLYDNGTVDIYASGTRRRMNVPLEAISPVVKVNGGAL